VSHNFFDRPFFFLKQKGILYITVFGDYEMSLKIFHTSDIHLGMKFAGYPEVQSELSEARFKTLENLVNLANSEKCDLFIIAGDLFDRVSVAKRDILRASQILQDFQGQLVVVLPGNHDFISGDKIDLWSHFKDSAPINVLILSEKRIYPLKHYDLDIHVYAAPCNAKHFEKMLSHGLKKHRRIEMFHITLALPMEALKAFHLILIKGIIL